MIRYRCWDPDTGEYEDGRDIVAVDPEYAAIKFARLYDQRSADYGYAKDGGEVAVAFEGVEIARFRVTGEQDIVYTARQIPGESP